MIITGSRAPLDETTLSIEVRLNASLPITGKGRCTDKRIRAKRQFEDDIRTKYNETSRAKLAVNVIEC